MPPAEFRTSHGAARGNVCIDSVSVGLQRFLLVINLLKLIGCVCHNGMSMGSVTALVGICLNFLATSVPSFLTAAFTWHLMAWRTLVQARVSSLKFHTDAPSAHLGAEERI